MKRKNYSKHTIRNYLHRLQSFLVWIAVPVEAVRPVDVNYYIEYLMEKRLSAETINAHLVVIRRFYSYLGDEEEIEIDNPAVEGIALRLPKPLPRHLRDNDLATFFEVVHKSRDMAMFVLMLRCGLRVEEVANLTLAAIDYKRHQVLVRNGKGAKDRVVYLSDDAANTLAVYLRSRPQTTEKHIFLVEKGPHKGKVISVRGIQKRIEYYSKKSGTSVSCHKLRHTMATQLLNAGAGLVTIQNLLGHSRIKTTMRYCKLSNLKAEREYHEAVAKILIKSGITLAGNLRC